MDRQQAFVTMVQTGILLNTPTNSFDGLLKALRTLEIACDQPVTMIPSGSLTDAVFDFLSWNLVGNQKPSWVVE